MNEFDRSTEPPARGYLVSYMLRDPATPHPVSIHERSPLAVSCLHAELVDGALVLVFDDTTERWIPLSNIDGAISVIRLTDEVDDLGLPDEAPHLAEIARRLKILNSKTPDGQASGAGDHKAA